MSDGRLSDAEVAAVWGALERGAYCVSNDMFRAFREHYDRLAAAHQTDSERVAQFEAVLGNIEWGSWTVQGCPVCGGDEPNHYKDCALAAALSATPEPKEASGG